MLLRFLNRLKFELERFVVRGALQRVTFIGIFIALISLVAGLIAVRISPQFENTADAIWWAFLRLTDPGYLGDDKGAALRTLSTIVTVLGYVVFLGALIAIMTQWLNATMQRLESGLTPIAANNHVVILGYSDRTPAIVRELLTSEARVARFLRARGAGRLKIVILAEQVNLETVQDLKDRLGRLWRPRQIILRSGTPLRIEHLERVDFLHAAAILLPSHDLEGEVTSMPDGRTVKALLATSTAGASRPEALPLVVAEIVDGRRADIARRAYGGPSEILATDALVARLIAQTLREPGITAVYEELLAPSGEHEVFVRAVPEMNGVRFWSALRAFDRAVAIGVIRRTNGEVESILAPPKDFVIEPNDELVFVAKEFEDCEPSSAPKALTEKSGGSIPPPPPRPRRRVLVLGWNHKVPALVRELALDPSSEGPHRIDIVSSKPADERLKVMPADACPECTVRQIEGDIASASDLERIEPATYETIVFMASDRLDSAYESDARTILAHLVLDNVLAKKGKKRPSIVVELMSQENVELISSSSSEMIVSPVILSHILTQVALRRELHAVYVELFGSGGAELVLRSPASYGFMEGELSFSTIQAAAEEAGEVALGIRRADVASLAPLPSAKWNLTPEDRIVVVARAT